MHINKMTEEHNATTKKAKTIFFEYPLFVDVLEPVNKKGKGTGITITQKEYIYRKITQLPYVMRT